MSDEPLGTTKAVIKALGGSTAVGRLTGRKVQAASNWAALGTFPANTFVILQAALRAKGLSAPLTLWDMQEAPAELSGDAA